MIIRTQYFSVNLIPENKGDLNLIKAMQKEIRKETDPDPDGYSDIYYEGLIYDDGSVAMKNVKHLDQARPSTMLGDDYLELCR